MNEMSKEEKQAYNNGWNDKINGHNRAIAQCREMAKGGNKMAAAYVKGYDKSGVGE